MNDEKLIEGFTGPREEAEAIKRLVKAAEHKLQIFTHLLRPEVYEDEEIIDEFKRIVLRHQSCQLHVCVQNHLHEQPDCPRFLELMRRIPSRIEIRLASAHHQELNTNYLLADGRHYVRIPVHWRQEGKLYLNDIEGVKELENEFNEIWDHASPHPRIKRLGI